MIIIIVAGRIVSLRPIGALNSYYNNFFLNRLSVCPIHFDRLRLKSSKISLIENLVRFFTVGIIRFNSVKKKKRFVR